MFWSTSKVEFSPEDTRNYVDLALPRIRELLGESVFVSADAPQSLITQTYVQNQVEQLLADATTLLDSTAIANQLKIDKTALNTVLAKGVASSSAYADGVHILPLKYIEFIGNTLTDKVWHLSDICAQFKITIKAAEYIAKRKGAKLTLLGTFVVPDKILEQHEYSFKRKLASAQEPIKYSDIEEDEVLLSLVKSRLQIAAHETMYYPELFLESKTSEAQKLLQKAGYIGLSTLQNIIDPFKFSRANNAQLIGSWIVLESFVAEKTSEISQTLSTQLYFDLKDLPLGPDLARYILSQEPKLEKMKNTKKFPQHYLVRPQLERQVTDEVKAKVAELASDRAQSVQLEVNGTSALTEWLDTIELPSLAEIQALIPETLPTELKLPELIFPSIRTYFREVVSRQLEPRFEEAQTRLEAQIRVHLNGILSLKKDSELYNLAWEEWQQYVSDKQYSVPVNTEVALNQFKISPSVVLETLDRVTTKSKVKLTKAKDTALILHLAATLYHRQHFCEDGILKIRGKAIPKLLKSFEFPQSFGELKNQLKNASPELIESVKSAVQ